VVTINREVAMAVTINREVAMAVTINRVVATVVVTSSKDRVGKEEDMVEMTPHQTTLVDTEEVTKVVRVEGMATTTKAPASVEATKVAKVEATVMTIKAPVDTVEATRAVARAVARAATTVATTIATIRAGTKVGTQILALETANLSRRV